MSDKVVPLFTENKNRGKLPVFKILLFLLVILLVLFSVLVFALPDVFNLDAAKRYFKYLGDDGNESFGHISYDADSSNAYGTTADLFAVGTEGGLYLFDNKGQQKSLIQGALPNPTVRTNDRYALCYGCGGSFFTVADRNGKAVFSKTVDGQILDAQVTERGYVCVVTSEEGYKSVATVYDAKQQEIYKWYSATQYLNSCALSDDGKYLAIVGLGQEQSVFSSSVTLLKTDSEQPLGTAKLGNQLIYAMSFVGKNTLCAVGQDSVLYLNTAAETISEMTFDERYLQDFCFADDWLALTVNESKAGSKCTLITLDSDGTQIAELYVGLQINSLSVRGRYVCALTSEGLHIYSNKLKSYAANDQPGTATTALMRADGTALLVSGSKAELFLP